MAKKTEDLKLDMDAIQNQHIVKVDLNSEMKKAYIDKGWRPRVVCVRRQSDMK